MSDNVILRVENLKKYFVIGHTGVINREPITVKSIDGVNFEIDEGETLGLVGESGSGKSVTAQAIAIVGFNHGGQRATFMQRGDIASCGNGFNHI